MPWLAGTFDRANGAAGWANDAAANIGIEAGRHDTQDNDFRDGINETLNKAGQNSPTADLPMGAFKHTNVANATARNQYAAVGQVQDGDYIWLGTTGGTATAMTASASPAITAYKAGQKFRMKPNTASTGQVYTSHTLAVNGLTAVSIIEQDGQSPTLGSWQTGTGRVLELTYNDGFFVIGDAPRYFQTYTSAVTPQNGTATGVTFTISKFIRLGNSVSFQVYVSWTQNTASASYIDISLPIRPSSTFQNLSCAITTSANLVTGFAFVGSTVGSGVARCYDATQQQILTGSKQLTLSGTYEIG